MKINFTKILVVFATILFFSCQVEPVDSVLAGQANNPNPNSNSNPSSTVSEFKAFFDSQLWVANSVQAIVNTDYISITATKSSGEFFQITIPGATVGTYTLDMASTSSTPFGMIYSRGSGNIPYMAADDDTGVFANLPNYTDTAKIVISSIDTVNKKISGTFQFTGVRFAAGGGTSIETKVFTDGVFNNLAYTADVPAPANNNFSAKLNGVNFVPTNITGVKMSGYISVIGRKGNIENISLAIPDNVISGATYDFTAFSSTARGQYVDAASTAYGGDGTMTIISHNPTTKRISGTFSFNASSLIPPVTNHSVTAGTFDITYL